MADKTGLSKNDGTEGEMTWADEFGKPHESDALEEVAQLWLL